jgi:hypothetical protein
MLSLDDCLSRNKNSTQEYVHPSANKEPIHVAKARKMPRACSDLQRGGNLRIVSVKIHEKLQCIKQKPTPLAKPGVSGIQATNHATTARQFVPYWL